MQSESRSKSKELYQVCVYSIHFHYSFCSKLFHDFFFVL
uniref:Uncharacterized protein n=1 Tax=Brassica campestris TaxID=3711 RepID=A0A3P5Z7U8_BRACM|nr:unnamed protein product [Brassica rapa]VDD04696.1 unnamed protein product [Brassica rapa]